MNSSLGGQALFWKVALCVFIAIILTLAPSLTLWIILTNSGYSTLFASLLLAASVSIFGFLAAWAVSRIVTLPLQHITYLLHRYRIEHATPTKPQKMLVGQQIIDTILNDFSAVVDQLRSLSESSSKHSQVIESALNAIPHPILAINQDTRILYANQSAVDFLNKNQQQELIGSLIHERLNLRKENTPFLEKWIQQSQTSTVNNEHHWREIAHAGTSQQTYSFDVYARFRRNTDPNQTETTIMLLDRTLEREHEDLKVDFVAMAAHELRAPITVIRGYIEVLDDELEDALTPELKEFMNRLEVSSAQLSSFINNILSVARIDRGEMSVKLEKREWGTVLKQALQDLSLRAQAHGKVLRADIADNLPEVAVDPISIVEVINNLVDNAIKYSHDRPDIVVRSRLREDGQVETIVQDFGVGIPSNLVDKLFTKFYRSHRTSNSFGGSGLGLYISRAIVKAHHGSVWVQSTEGQGSTFGFSLPQYSEVAGVIEANNDKLEAKHGWIKNHSKYRR